jgi:hypothetical protein
VNRLAAGLPLKPNFRWLPTLHTRSPLVAVVRQAPKELTAFLQRLRARAVVAVSAPKTGQMVSLVALVAVLAERLELVVLGQLGKAIKAGIVLLLHKRLAAVVLAVLVATPMMVQVVLA